MKFSHEFQEALHREGFPEHWINSAIPYGQLKKLVKKVANELSRLGLDPLILNNLVTSNSGMDAEGRRGSGDVPVIFQYDFAGRQHLVQSYNFLSDVLAEERENVVPRLTLYVQLEDGIAVDATFSPDSWKYLERLSQQASSRGKGDGQMDSEIQTEGSVLPL